MILVALQVFDNLISGGISRPARGHRKTGQGREALGSVQMESVVMPPPRRRHNVFGFYDLELAPTPEKLCRCGQASGRSSDYQSPGGPAHASDITNCRP